MKLKSTLTAVAFAVAATCSASADDDNSCGKYLDGYDIADRKWAEATVEDHPVLLRFGDDDLEAKGDPEVKAAADALLAAGRSSGNALEAWQWLYCTEDPEAHLNNPTYPTTDEAVEVLERILAMGPALKALSEALNE